MLVETIRDAVGTLQREGQKISIRAVHALTGGSFRDISHLLKTAVLPAGAVLPDLEGCPRHRGAAPG